MISTRRRFLQNAAGLLIPAAVGLALPRIAKSQILPGILAGSPAIANTFGFVQHLKAWATASGTSTATVSITSAAAGNLLVAIGVMHDGGTLTCDDSIGAGGWTQRATFYWSEATLVAPRIYVWTKVAVGGETSVSAVRATGSQVKLITAGEYSKTAGTPSVDVAAISNNLSSGWWHGPGTFSFPASTNILHIVGGVANRAFNSSSDANYWTDNKQDSSYINVNGSDRITTSGTSYNAANLYTASNTSTYSLTFAVPIKCS